EASAREVPRFDLIFLGLGPDGHTVSLFPGHTALDETRRLVIPIADSPKPPPGRVTFTLPLLNAARNVVFLATGSEKREACARARRGDRALPAGRVSPAEGRLLWLIDRNAS
ncbi:MAG: 6-phosphogluconolactonase, partial [Thermoanaerobaculia bacterium]